MARKVGVGGGAINADPTVKYRPCSSAARSAATSFTYDSASRRTALTLPNGVVVNYTYSQASQITGITYQMGSTTLGNLTYGYDNDGRVTSVGGSFARTGLPQALSSATYDASNELTKWGTTNLSYDPNGNLTSDGANTYTWDARNQLASVNAGGTNFSFQYDAFGRRITNPSGNSLLYDGGNAVQELSGGSAVANRLAGGIDEFFSRTDATGAFSPLTDALGSTVALADSTGALQTQYTYEPFGNTTISGPGNANPYQYTGRENDGTGLYYYRARYYSPIYQRFISEDPLGFAGGDANLYAYTSDSPTNFTDPEGKQVGELALGGAEVGSVFGPEGTAIGAGVGAAVGLGIDAYLAYELWKHNADDAANPPDAQSQPVPKNPPDTAHKKPPDPNNPPPEWVPHRNGDPDTWYDPTTGETWHWHEDPTGSHGGDHWDIGGPRGPNGEPGQKDWWPADGRPRGPKPPGGQRTP